MLRPLPNKASSEGGDYWPLVSPHLFDHLMNCIGIFKYLHSYSITMHDGDYSNVTL